MALINRWGYQLFPNKGDREIIHDPTWMFTSNVGGCGNADAQFRSVQKFYTFKEEDDELGRDGNHNDFITHAARTEDYGGKWDFSKGDAA